MTTAQDIADYFIGLGHERGEEVNNLKLQRLLYYAQAWHLGERGTPLFDEKFEAWMTGPVIPALYWAYKPHGIRPLPAPSTAPCLPSGITRFLDRIADDYLRIDEYELDEMSTRETPWQAARVGLDRAEPSRNEISEDDMRTFFRALAAAA